MTSKLTRQPEGISVPALFSAQLWAAVGLQPKALNISRLVFSPDPSAHVCSTLPSSSRDASDRLQQAVASSRAAEVGVRINDLHSAKRRRRSQDRVVSFFDEEGASFSCRAGPALDYDALRKFPTRPRTGTRRPTQQLRSIALDLGLETARTLRLGSHSRLAVLGGPNTQSIMQASTSDQAAPAQVHGVSLSACDMEVEHNIVEDSSFAVAALKPLPSEVDSLSEEEACCMSVDESPVLGMPTSHSGTSSQGVFGFGLPSSPMNDAGVGNSIASKHADGKVELEDGHRDGPDWAMCSPVSEEGSVGCQD